MKALSSAVSITLHAAVGAAVLLGTTKTVQSDPARIDTTPFIFVPETPTNHGVGRGGPPLPGPIAVAPPKFNFDPGVGAIPAGVVSQPLFSPAFSTAAGSGSTRANSWSGVTEEHAEVLSGPLPLYPELLRQAGVEGKVVLEAVVDTTGRVLPTSILIVSATNSGFVAAARQALLKTLFRPAMVGDKMVRMRVRIPYEFAIQNGTRHAR